MFLLTYLLTYCVRQAAGRVHASEELDPPGLERRLINSSTYRYWQVNNLLCYLHRLTV